MSLAKLTSISTHTLTLLLERQRLQTFETFSSPDPANANPLHLPQIRKNLKQLRSGILELESKEGKIEALQLLRNQYERMCSMLGPDPEVESLVDPQAPSSPALPTLPPPPPAKDTEPVYTPYTDDPDTEGDPGIMLQTQRRLMNEQDDHLDRLSQSIGRQHHISLQINDELDVHTGLLQELDSDLDNTSSRLGGARRSLDRVAKGAKEHGTFLLLARF
ncbi:hypothetical protein HGRIS_014142 [Hohenbuehelia grisea]|uniref:t-SNARE coiled-coil homology domain-containing protein n=1 Tax=Hohenbuehelia grisea TaxID=104357 RepID=A0ABR3JU72_9AGAR